MAEAQTVYCGPCEFKHLSIPAVSWCPTCNEGMCKDCKEQHIAFSATRRHEIISIENYLKIPSVILDMNQTCKIHGSKWDFFCYSHNEPCCLKCVPSTHKECPNICPLDEIVQQAKQSSALTDTKQGITDLLQNIKKILRLKKGNIKSLGEEKLQIAGEIKRLRQDLNTILDNLEAVLLKNLNAVYTKQINGIQNDAKTMENEIAELLNFSEQCNAFGEYASDMQTFLGTRNLRTVLEEKEMTYMKKRKEVKVVHVNISMDQDLLKMKSTLTSLGKITTSFSDVNIDTTIGKAKQAQNVISFEAISIKDLTLKLNAEAVFQSKIFFKDKNVRSCSMLNDGKIVIPDGQYLMIFNSDGSHIRNIDMGNHVGSVVAMNNLNFAVTVHKNDVSEIQILNAFQTDTNTKPVFSFKHAALVAYTNGKLLACIERTNAKELCFINLKTETIETISFTDNIPFFCCFQGSKIFYKARSTDSFICFDIDKHQVTWEYRLPIPGETEYSLAVDKFYNLYIACYMTDQVLVIANSGKDFKTLLTSNDGLHGPTGIDINRQKGKLLVCVNYKEKAHLYDIIY